MSYTLYSNILRTETLHAPTNQMIVSHLVLTVAAMNLLDGMNLAFDIGSLHTA